MRGVQDERWVWDDIAQTIREVEPEVVFLENVPGLANGGLSHVLGTLAEVGFDAEWDLSRASEVGAPHKRERLFLLALRRQLPNAQSGFVRLLTKRNQLESPKRRNSKPRDVGEEVLAISARDRDRRRATGRGAEPLADASNDLGRARVERAKDRTGAAKVGRVGPSVGGPELADGDGKRCEGVHVGRNKRIAELDGCDPEMAAGSGERLFPPSPIGDWSNIDAERLPATAQPTLRRMANGLPGRVDRLRALGNGVVPQQVAFAIRVLARRFGEPDGS